MTTHLPTCRVRNTIINGEHVTYSEPDQDCQHESHEQ